MLNTIARLGSYNQGLSYFYVDLLNCIDTLQECINRMSQLCVVAKQHYDSTDHVFDFPQDDSSALNVTDYYQNSVLKSLNQLSQQVNFISTFLRHKYYATLKSSGEDLYTHVSYALGDIEFVNSTPQPDDVSELLVVLLLEIVMLDVIETVQDFISTKC